MLKGLIAYFREVQLTYERKCESYTGLTKMLGTTQSAWEFLMPKAMGDTFHLLDDYNEKALEEANKAREIHDKIILALAGLRDNLLLKIKEIRSFSGEFKNSVDKEMATSQRAIDHLHDALKQWDTNPASINSSQDPYLLRLIAERNLRKQFKAENSLHQVS